MYVGPGPGQGQLPWIDVSPQGFSQRLVPSSSRLALCRRDGPIAQGLRCGAVNIVGRALILTGFSQAAVQVKD